VTKDRKVVAILPAYNLEGSIGNIVARTIPYVDQVMVVADGSSDDTAGAARAAGAMVPEPEFKRGKGFALIKGIECSKAEAPDIVIVMDADGQHLPEEIPTMLAPLTTNDQASGREATSNSVVDMVVGSRMLGTLRTSRVNKFGNWGLKIISFVVTGRWLTDTESGFRAFRADRLYAMPLRSVGYEIESELLLRGLHAGFRVVEVPITVPFAVPGVTVWDGLKVGWYKLKTGLALRFGMEPR